MPLRKLNNSIIKTAILLLYVMTHYAFKNIFFSHTKKSKFILFTIVVLQFYLRSHRPLCSWRVTLSIISNSGLLFVTATTGLSKSPFILIQKGTLIPHLTFDFDSWRSLWIWPASKFKTMTNFHIKITWLHSCRPNRDTADQVDFPDHTVVGSNKKTDRATRFQSKSCQLLCTTRGSLQQIEAMEI